MTRHVGRTDNDMETVMGETDTNMDDMNDQENITEVEVNNLINEVVTMERRMEELDKQHAEEIRKYKVRILDLKNQVATLTMGEAGSSSSTPIAPTNMNFQSLEAERDTTLQEAKIAKSQALEVCMRNEIMREKMEALQKEVVDMQQ